MEHKAASSDARNASARGNTLVLGSPLSTPRLRRYLASAAVGVSLVRVSTDCIKSRFETLAWPGIEVVHERGGSLEDFGCQWHKTHLVKAYRLVYST